MSETQKRLPFDAVRDARQIHDNFSVDGAPQKIAALRTALEAAPRDNQSRRRLANVLLQANELDGAEHEVQILLGDAPNDIDSINLLGVVQKRRGRLSDAIATFRLGAKIAPANTAVWYNLGNTLIAAGQPAQAVEPLRQALDLKIDSSEIARLLGLALAADGKLGQALAAFDRAQNLDPKNPHVPTSRASALKQAGAPNALVLAELERAQTLDPTSLEPLRERAIFLQLDNRNDEALETHLAVLKRDPNDIETLLRLGHLLGYSLERYEEANAYLRRAVALRPNDPRCLATLCKSLIDSRYGAESEHVEESATVARNLLGLGCDLAPYASNLINVFLRLAEFDSLEALGPAAKLMPYWIEKLNVGALHNQLARVKTIEDRHDLVRWHGAWAERVEAVADMVPINHRGPKPRPNAKIRVGLMSSDLRDHPVAYFALPLIERYDRERFEVRAYSFHPAAPDAVQSYIRDRLDGFCTLAQASDAEIAQHIADDDLDILFELGGTTRYNRLEVLAYRPAPIQVSWLGYPHSAGLRAIDHVMVDPKLVPTDPKLLLETPLVLPESWVVFSGRMFRDWPIEERIPEERFGAVTFGTMNNPYKYTREIFGLWARVMERTPGSRFLFVRPEAGAPSFRANVVGEFAKHGIASNRILFEAVRGQHMPHYNRIDIALDCAPQTGGTTTAEALWMGVPTVTLVGPALYERLSYSLLSNAGLGDLCAPSPQTYVDTAAALASDPTRRSDLRTSLRPRIRDGVLGDEGRWVQHFEATIERLVRTGHA